MIEAVHHTNAVVIRVLASELEMYKVPEFRNSVTQELGNKPAIVVLDLEKVESIDSSAIGALFYFNKSVKNQSGKLILANLTDQVAAILEATQSMGLLSVRASVEEALAPAQQAAV